MQAEWEYPLEWGQTLSNHDWVPLQINRLLTSNFVIKAVAENRRGDIGTALLLWSESFKQDPAGALPDDDVHLAHLAKFGPDVRAWRSVREGALYGWEPVAIPGEALRSQGPRLGHPVIAAQAHDMYQRKLGRDSGREQNRLNQMATRVRTKMRELGCRKAMIENRSIPAAIVRFLDQNRLFVTTENVELALDQAPEIPRVVGGTNHGED